MNDTTQTTEQAQEIAGIEPATLNGTSPTPDTAVLLSQARERNRVAVEALADAELELERAREHLVQTPGRPSQEAVAWARELALQAFDERDASDAAVKVYSARFEKEEAAASYARAVALLEKIAAERAEKANAIATEETARREHLEAARRGHEARLASVPISAEECQLRYNESEDERQSRLLNTRLRGWALLDRVQDAARDRRDREDADR